VMVDLSISQGLREFDTQRSLSFGSYAHRDI